VFRVLLAVFAGFLQERSGKGDRLTLPKGPSTVNVTVMPSFSGTADDTPLVIPVKLNASYGSFHVVIDVPAGAKPGQYSLNLNVPKTRSGAAAAASVSDDDNSASIASESFTVGNPRPPTATLNITVPDWVGGVSLGSLLKLLLAEGIAV
jgi:hypothetical protein